MNRIKISISAMPRDMNTAITKSLTDMSKELIRDIRQTAPRAEHRPPDRKGQRYNMSWSVDKRTPRTISIKTTQGFLYRILEFTGARAGIRVPKKAKALRWYTRNNRPVFSKKVRFPGFKPIPHVRPALKRVLRAGPDIASHHFARANPAFHKDAARAASAVRTKLQTSRSARRATGKKRLRRRATVRTKNVT